MRVVLLILIAVFVLLVVSAIYVRLAPLDRDALHVDPDSVAAPERPNYELIAGENAVIIPADLDAVTNQFERVAREDGAEVLAGDFQSGHVTLVSRSRLFGFPDIVSLRLTQMGEGQMGAGTRVAIFSRAVFGYSDLGVNAKRVERWMSAARGAR